MSDYRRGYLDGITACEEAIRGARLFVLTHELTNTEPDGKFAGEMIEAFADTLIAGIEKARANIEAKSTE